MENYSLVNIMSEKMAVLYSTRYGEQIWSLVNLTKKKIGMDCAICSGTLKKTGYRPITNLGNRMDRICPRCLQFPIDQDANNKGDLEE